MDAFALFRVVEEFFDRHPATSNHFGKEAPIGVVLNSCGFLFLGLGVDIDDASRVIVHRIGIRHPAGFLAFLDGFKTIGIALQ